MPIRAVTILFPHQLFEDNPAVEPGREVILVEEKLFFRQYRFHKKKILFHRASMKFYEHDLKERGVEVTYIESAEETSDIWDGLYWRFIYSHQTRLSNNPRMAMMLGNLDRMDRDKLQAHRTRGESFLQALERST